MADITIFFSENSVPNIHLEKSHSCTYGTVLAVGGRILLRLLHLHSQNIQRGFAQLMKIDSCTFGTQVAVSCCFIGFRVDLDVCIDKLYYRSLFAVVYIHTELWQILKLHFMVRLIMLFSSVSL
jgi:hypothetical protein